MVSVEVKVHANIGKSRAFLKKAGSTCWLTIMVDGSEVIIFGGNEHADALGMMADVFNDAFAAKAERPTIPDPAARPTSDDLPF